MTNPLKWLILAVCLSILGAVAIVAMLPYMIEEGSITEKSIQEEEMEVIGSYKMGAFLSVWKIHDNKDNVTCWTTNTEGISCIPDHMLSP